MKAALPSATFVSGPAHDPHCVHADGSRTSLGFFHDFPPGTRVLDIGAGDGAHLAALTDRGCRPLGVELDSSKVESLRHRGFDVALGRAECLPVADRSFDAVICSVVVPYTDECRAIAEWSRVLVPGGQVRASYHLLAYAVRQVLLGPGPGVRCYGGRTIVNSWLYSLTGRRLPWFWGDTLYQSAGRLRRHYRAAGLSIVVQYTRRLWRAWPDLLFHHLQKAA
jgi:SAM-dependent methyltransferase